MPSRSLQALLEGIVDYAGLFPPARLDMQRTVDLYAQYLAGEHQWMLGRLICPVSKLESFRSATRDRLPRRTGEGPWVLSAIIDGDLDENLDSIFAFNHEHSKPAEGLALIDAVELKAEHPGFIDEALDDIPEDITPFFEIPLSGDVRGFVAALAGNDAAAKIRTGALTADGIPGADLVAGFIEACAAADVPFKATAGLHHPVRAEHPLTYEPDCPRGVMHGFFNVFFAAALIGARRLDRAQAVRLLEERDASAFTFADDHAAWRDVRAPLELIEQTRQRFAVSFGSCSFEEPVQDLKGLGLL